MRAIEAVIDENGRVRLLEAVALPAARRELVIVPEKPAKVVEQAALLSEAALAKDWEGPEEDAAWAHLQPAP